MKTFVKQIFEQENHFGIVEKKQENHFLQINMEKKKHIKCA
jgi:hypothetical protein